jgi:hypothetical protein
LGLQTEKSGCRKKNGMTSKAASKRMWEWGMDATFERRYEVSRVWTKHSKNMEITAMPKQTIAGRKWESEKESNKVDRERIHKTIGSYYNETMSGNPGTEDSSSEAEKPMGMGNWERGGWATSQEQEDSKIMDD